MIGVAGRRPESGGHWATASVLSVVAHAAALVWVLDLVPSFAPSPPPRMPDTVITIAPAVVIDNADPALAPAPDAATEPPVETANEVPTSETLSPEASARTTDPAEVVPSETAAAVPETVQTLAPVQGETLAPAAAAPATLAPLALDTPGATAAPVAVLGAAPLVAEQSQTAVPVETISGGDTGVGRIASVLPARPPTAPRAPPPPASPQDAALTDLIERIRGRLDEACLVALPRPQAPPLGPVVVTVSDQDVTAAGFARDVLEDTLLPIDESRLLIDARQCPALTFLRSRAAYPAFQLRLAVARTQLASGETLVGRIENAAGAYTSLLLVDDNGVVQDLRRFLRFTGGQAEFAVPVTRDGPPRETAQLLIALATPARLDTITTLAGRLASDLFPPLEAELPTSARLAVQLIDVR